MAVRNLREVSKGAWDCDGKNGYPTDKEIQSGCQQRIADAQEARVKQGERQIEIMERRTVVAETAVKDKTDLIAQNFAFGRTNNMLQDAIKKLSVDRDGWKQKVDIQRVGVKHLYRRIAALRGVITRMKRIAG